LGVEDLTDRTFLQNCKFAESAEELQLPLNIFQKVLLKMEALYSCFKNQNSGPFQKESIIIKRILF
jgi:hypothetical protein